MSDVILVLATAPSMEKAAEIGRVLVNEQLAACANLVPEIRSIYRWEGKLCDDEEVLMLVKTQAGLFDRLRARIASLHPYMVPEILRVDIAEGHAPYLDWVRASVAPASRE